MTVDLILLFLFLIQTSKRTMINGTTSLKALDHHSPQGPHSICPTYRHTGAAQQHPWPSIRKWSSRSFFIDWEGVIALLIGWLGNLILNSCWDLDHLLIWETDFLGTEPRWCGEQAVGWGWGGPSPKLSTMSPINPASRLLTLGQCGRNEATGWREISHLGAL